MSYDNFVSGTKKVANPPPDTRKAAWSPEQWRTQSLPAPRRNGFLVTEDKGSDGITYYAQSRAPPGHNGPARRQQSLPSRRAEGGDTQRQANSAPFRKNRSQSQKPPPLVARSRGPGGDTSHIVTTNFAGMSTRDQEASPTRYTRFASTWAQVRAENHIDMCSPTSPGGGARKSGQEEDRSGDRPAARAAHSTGRSSHKEAFSSPRSRQDLATHSPSYDKENTKPGTQPTQPAPHTKKKSPEEREKQTIRFQLLNDKNEEDDGETDEEPMEARDVQEPRSSKRRPEWNNRLTLSVPQQSQTPAKSWRRYEAELTHIPTVTSTKQVYKAYTGRSKQQLRHREVSDDTDGDWLEERPSTRGSQQEGENGELNKPSSRSPREYILTRNEAKMFLHLQNVYGSEAYRQQRKQWFFKKLTEAQLQELQHQAEDRRRKHERIEESKKRQKRQLMYVRRKFRREQLHRFRTQYVTSRVLEYEKGDRELYGLPGDWEDDEMRSSDDDYDFEKQDSKTGDRKVKDTSQSDNGSNKKTPETISEQGVKDSQTHSTQPGKTSQKTVRKSTPDASEPKPSVAFSTVPSSNGKDRLASGPSSKDKTTDPKTTATKNSIKAEGGSLPQPHSDKSGTRPTATKNSKQNPNNNQASKSAASEPTKSAITSSNDNRDSSSNTGADTATSGQKTPGDMSKTTKRDQQKTKTAKSTATTDHPNMNSTNSGAMTDSKSVGRDTSKASDGPGGADKKPSKNVSSSSTKTASDSSKSAPTGSSAIPTSAGTKNNKPSAAEPVASSSKATVSNKQGTKTQSQSTERDSKGTVNGAGDDSSSKQGKNDSVQKNKNDGLKTEKAGSVSDNKNDRVTKDKQDNSKQKQGSVLNNRKDGNVGDNKQSTISHDNKAVSSAKTKNSGAKDQSGQTTNTVPSSNHALNGHVSHPSNKPASNNPVAATSPTSKDAHNKTSTSRPTDSRGRKRKPAQTQPKSEAEQKKQFERKYGKIFEVNTGPSWNPGAKPPKMEGIDTVIVKVTDEKGHTRLKKREVKDVVKEAKAQLAARDPESRRSAAGKGDSRTLEPHNGIRPASADTLDFDDDEDDDDEDVFERVRRKYNLQIDSDDDDAIA